MREGNVKRFGSFTVIRAHVRTHNPEMRDIGSMIHDFTGLWSCRLPNRLHLLFHLLSSLHS
jgi:hypothetical protein